jgi:DNA repair exonuclease SbcCD ATPase subunit
MLRYITLRLTLPAVLSVTLLPAAAFAQSQDSQSVAEAARKARAQKKNPEKAPKVITDETLDVKKGDVQSATAEQPRMPGSPETPAQPAAAAAPGTPASPTATAAGSDSKDKKDSKEVADLKGKIKRAQDDLDLLQREQSLENDRYYSQTDYAKDTAGKAKLDDLKQQATDKQQELERLKARLAELQPAQSGAASTPPKP